VVDCAGDSSEGPLHSCYHGSMCQANGGSVSCNCDKLDDDGSPADAKFAGAMCQHESTSMCAVSLVGSHAPNHQFCTNHGECTKMVTGSEPHPGCICKDGWTGDHCEISRDPFTLPRLQEGEDEQSPGSGAAPWSLLIILVVAAASLAFVWSTKARNQRVDESNITFQTKKVYEGDLDADGSGTLGSRAEVVDETLRTFTIGDVEEDIVPESQLV